MPVTFCIICQKEFYAKLNHQKRGWGKYCSVQCRNRSLMKGEYVICGSCGKSIYKSPKSLLHSKSKNYFCNKKCQTTWRNKRFVGENSKNWINGIRAYRNIIKRTNLTEECFLCGISLKIVLVVHHVDKNRKNNNAANLVWLCRNCHHLVHNDSLSYERLHKKLCKTISQITN